MRSHLLQTGPSAPAESTHVSPKGTTLNESPDDRATDFQAVAGDTGEHFNGYTLMVEAYAAIWLILMVWLVFLWRKQAELGARVTGLEAAIARADKKAPPRVVAKSADKGKASEVEPVREADGRNADKEKEAVEGM